MEYSAEIIGIRIREKREKNHLTQAGLGKKLGVTGKQVFSYEKGKLCPPMDILIKLCKLFDCELGYLLGEDDYSSGTKLDTAIEKKLGLSTESISAIQHITGDTIESINCGVDSEAFQRILNSILCSHRFTSLIRSIYMLDQETQNKDNTWADLIEKYGEADFNEGMKLYKTYPYDLDDIENDTNIEEKYAHIIMDIDSCIDKQQEYEYPLKVLRYEARETYDRLLDELYPPQ